MLSFKSDRLKRIQDRVWKWNFTVAAMAAIFFSKRHLQKQPILGGVLPPG